MFALIGHSWLTVLSEVGTNMSGCSSHWQRSLHRSPQWEGARGGQDLCWSNEGSDITVSRLMRRLNDSDITPRVWVVVVVLKEGSWGYVPSINSLEMPRNWKSGRTVWIHPGHWKLFQPSTLYLISLCDSYNKKIRPVSLEGTSKNLHLIAGAAAGVTNHLLFECEHSSHITQTFVSSKYACRPWWVFAVFINRKSGDLEKGLASCCCALMFTSPHSVRLVVILSISRHTSLSGLQHSNGARNSWEKKNQMYPGIFCTSEGEIVRFTTCAVVRSSGSSNLILRTVINRAVEHRSTLDLKVSSCPAKVTFRNQRSMTMMVQVWDLLNNRTKDVFRWHLWTAHLALVA